MAIWLGVDWHLWTKDKKVKGLLFSNPNAETILSNCKKTIHPNDVFIYLGDLADATPEDIPTLQNYVMNIPGYKILVKGNHDTLSDGEYYDIGFSEVVEACRYGNIVFTHVPVMLDRDEINVHGHLHDENISSFGNNYINSYYITKENRPVSLDELLDKAAMAKSLDKTRARPGEYANYYKDCIQVQDLTDRIDDFSGCLYESTKGKKTLDEFMFPDWDSTKYYQSDDNKFHDAANAHCDDDVKNEDAYFQPGAPVCIGWEMIHKATEKLRKKISVNETVAMGSVVAITDDIIKKHKHEMPGLCHIRTGDNCSGKLWFDARGKAAAFYNVETNANGVKWLQALEVRKDMQGCGFGSQLLKMAVTDGATMLAVRPSNDRAFNMYRKAGFTLTGKPNRGITVDMTLTEDVHTDDPLKGDYYDYYEGWTGLDSRDCDEGVKPPKRIIKADETKDRLLFADKLNESTTSSKQLFPMYIMLMHTGTLMSNIIKKVTDSEFSHCSISFEPEMTKMYSFGRKMNVNPEWGEFRMENIRDEFFTSRDIPYALYVVPVTQAQLFNMKRRLDYFIKNKTKFKYNFIGLFKNYIGVADNPTYSYFCSQFVADILNSGRPRNPYIKEPSLMKPEDFKNQQFAIYVRGGVLNTYDVEITNSITEQILKTAVVEKDVIRTLGESVYDLPMNRYTEAALRIITRPMNEDALSDFIDYLRSFKIRFDKGGNVIVTRREYGNLRQHLNNSVKLIRTYTKAGNNEGLKQEACKLQYMINMISQNYATTKADDKALLKDMNDLRSLMINVFQQTIVEITKNEPNFNFQKFYDNSKYGQNIKIDQKTITAIGKTVKTVLM